LAAGADATGTAGVRDAIRRLRKDGAVSSENEDPNGPEPDPPIEVPPPAADVPDQPIEDPAPPPPDPAPSFEQPPPPATAAGTSAGTSFDISAVPRSVWISLGGAVLLLLSVFLNWYTLTVSIGDRSGSGSESGWDSGATAKIIVLLALVIIAAWLIELFADNLTLPLPAAIIAGATGMAAVLLVLFKFFSKPASDQVGQFNALGLGHASVGTDWGIWLALLGAAIAVVGAYMRMNEQS
jgi:hypothetical protein